MVTNMDLLVGEEVEAEAGDNFGEEVVAGAGDNFNVHILTVPTGEDVKSSILSVVKNWNTDICILSAIGKVSDVSLRQSEGSLRLKGSFPIVTLAGYFSLTETGDMSGELTVSLADNNAHLIGGSVADLLTAASPIQLVFRSFIPQNGNPQSAIPSANVASPNPLTSLATPEAGTSLSFTAKRLFQRLFHLPFRR